MKRSLIAAVVSATMATGAVAAESVEVLHWWTSGGEAAALGVLKKDLESQGITWNDMPVAGGGGEAAMTALRARVTSGNPPSAVQALGFDITDGVVSTSGGRWPDFCSKIDFNVQRPDPNSCLIACPAM